MASERTKAEKKFMRKFQQSTCIGFIDDVEIDFQERAKQQIQHIRDLIQEATHSLERETVRNAGGTSWQVRQGKQQSGRRG